VANKKQILIIDDSDDDATLLRLTLKAAGVINPAFVVSTGEEALAYFKGDGDFADRQRFPIPHVVFLDLKLPKMNGYEVLEWLQTRTYVNEMLIVVLSGNREMSSVGRAYLAGADTFLVKPCTREDIVYLNKYFYGRWITR
jgi:CheY-like chemotaxis protein